MRSAKLSKLSKLQVLTMSYSPLYSEYIAVKRLSSLRMKASTLPLSRQATLPHLSAQKRMLDAFCVLVWLCIWPESASMFISSILPAWTHVISRLSALRGHMNDILLRNAGLSTTVKISHYWGWLSAVSRYSIVARFVLPLVPPAT